MANSSYDYMTSLDASVNWPDGSLPMRYVRYEKSEVDVGTSAKASIRSLRKSSNMLWVRDRNMQTTSLTLLAQQRNGCRYSHTGGFVRVSGEMSTRRVETGNEIVPPSGDEEYKEPYRLWWLQVACGSEWISQGLGANDLTQYGWSGRGASPFVSVDNKIMASADSMLHNETDFIFEVPSGGQIYMEMSKPRSLVLRQIDVFFTSLKMEGVGDAINLESAQMRYGDGTGEVLEVRTMLTSRDSGVTAVSDQNGKIRYGVNARPGVVPDANWSGGYYAGPSGYSGIPMSGVLLEQLTERYTQPRMAYQMTVRDVLMPYCAVAYKGGEYTVEAYEMDLYESETRVTID
jgi:hypothetical protein